MAIANETSGARETPTLDEVNVGLLRMEYESRTLGLAANRAVSVTTTEQKDLYI